MRTINTISDNLILKSGPEWLVNPNICLVNTRGSTTIAKWSRLLENLITKQIELTLITETWLDHTFDENVASLFRLYTVIGRRDRCNGPHGGVIALKRVSASINFSKTPLDDCFDFACAFVLNSRNVSPILLLLVYLPPSSSRYSVSANELSACIDSLLNYSVSEHSISVLHFCVLGDFNLPKSQCKTLSTSVDHEIQILDILNNQFLSPITINTPMYIANIFLNNILVSDRSLSNLLSIDSSANISDHYPIIFECNVSEQLLLVSRPLQHMRSLNNFRSYWQLFDYSNHPSSTVEEFYLHLHSAVAPTLVKKRTKRIKLPYYYTSHTVFCYNRRETLKRRCIRNPAIRNVTTLNSSQKDFDESVELDRITSLHCSSTHFISESFKLLRSLSCRTLPEIMFRGDNCFNSAAEIVNGFKDFFVENFKLQ